MKENEGNERKKIVTRNERKRRKEKNQKKMNEVEKNCAFSNAIVFGIYHQL